jgi:hypothetical protein
MTDRGTKRAPRPPALLVTAGIAESFYWEGPPSASGMSIFGSAPKNTVTGEAEGGKALPYVVAVQLTVGVAEVPELMKPNVVEPLAASAPL